MHTVHVSNIVRALQENGISFVNPNGFGITQIVTASI